MNLKVDSEIELRQIQMSDADDIFNTINAQRNYLGKWLPFVKETKDVSSISDFINYVRNKPKESAELAFTIRKDNKFIGLIDVKTTDLLNRKTEIGYWLSEGFQGQGIMTKAVQRICDFAFHDLKLNRVQIKCASKNVSSQNIAIRLGFVLEGIERDGELLANNEFTDLKIYSKLKND